MATLYIEKLSLVRGLNSLTHNNRSWSLHSRSGLLHIHGFRLPLQLETSRCQAIKPPTDMQHIAMKVRTIQ